MELQPDKASLTNFTLPQLDEIEKLSLHDPMVLEEVIEAIKSMKSHRSPGTDGISIEVYLKLSWKLAPLLLEVFHETIRDKQLHVHLSARRGIITLLEKKGHDPLLVSNWRPISLLNVDYKIFSKILAIRMNVVLPKLIHAMQSGFMKNRSIGNH